MSTQTSSDWIIGMRDAYLIGATAFIVLAGTTSLYSFYRQNHINAHLDSSSIFVGQQRVLSPLPRFLGMYAYNRDIDSDGLFETVGLEWDPTYRQYNEFEIVLEKDSTGNSWTIKRVALEDKVP